MQQYLRDMMSPTERRAALRLKCKRSRILGKAKLIYSIIPAGRASDISQLPNLRQLGPCLCVASAKIWLRIYGVFIRHICSDSENGLARQLRIAYLPYWVGE